MSSNEQPNQTTTVIGPWSNDKRCTITVRGNAVEVFHVYGVPPNMNRVWFRARCEDHLDPVPMTLKFTAMIRALERHFA